MPLIVLKGGVVMATVPTQIRIDEELKKQAMEEAKKISRDPDTKKYTSFSEALEDLDS